MAGTEILKDEPTATCGAYVSISLRPAVGNPSYAKVRTDTQSYG